MRPDIHYKVQKVLEKYEGYFFKKTVVSYYLNGYVKAAITYENDSFFYFTLFWGGDNPENSEPARFMEKLKIAKSWLKEDLSEEKLLEKIIPIETGEPVKNVI